MVLEVMCRMCGIVGYVGSKRAAPILLSGLTRLEYRGYDSAGLAVRDADADPVIVKAKGRLKVLKEKTDDGRAVPGNCGIGHTRWATHGEPSENNAHPHVSDDMNVIGVHNGIIENYRELKDKLLRNGYRFYSETDTEVAVKLVDYYYKKYRIGPVDAITRTMARVRGSYALALMFEDYPGQLFAARKDSPLIIGAGEGETFLASDVPAILNYTRDMYYIDNLELCRLDENGPVFYDLNGDEVPKDSTRIEWDPEAAEKGGWEHFMMKEIHEQPKAVADTLNSCLKEDGADLEKLGIPEEVLRSTCDVRFVACGSAYHVGLVLKNVTEELARVPVRVELASEFRYSHPILNENTLTVVISQSGETADSLAALREAKRLGAVTVGIVNVLGSSIAREADHVIYTLAGPEIAVATTKAYSAQLAAGYLLAIALGKARGCLSPEREAELATALRLLPEQIGRVLQEKERIQWFASKVSNRRDVFFIGRGLDFAVGMEGSLKLKEISYIHSEAYAAGELKHGTISLIEDGTLVIGVLTDPDLYEKTLSNMVEASSRGAYLMGLTVYGHYNIEDTADFTVYIPKTDRLFSASLAVIPLQLMAYYVSVARGLDVDKPRNLAKSVTVE